MNLRNTKNKQAIKEVLKNARTPQSVPDILQALDKQNIHLNKTVVYRNLESFLQDGFISEVNLNDGITRFEQKRDHHHHLVCSNCQSIEHIKLNEVEDLLTENQKKILKSNQFKIITHNLEFFGLCKGCQQ
jgi:Fur family ferric uptake transcriptional regulator